MLQAQPVSGGAGDAWFGGDSGLGSGMRLRACTIKPNKRLFDA